MPEGYQSVDNNEVGQVRDALESLVTEGARRMLESALEEEVRSFLGRGPLSTPQRVSRLPQPLSSFS